MFRHSPLFLILLLMAIVDNIDWRVELPMENLPEPVCQEIVLPALDKQESGFLEKAVEPHTNDLGLWALFLDGRVEGPFVFRVTAYNEHDDFTPGRITASGVEIFEGVAACGPEIALGTVIVLENGMVLWCLDRGGWITDGRLDVYLDDLGEAQRFGIQRLRGVILR